MKHRFIKLLSCLLLVACLLSMGLAVNAQTVPEEPADATPTSVEPRMEETEWVFCDFGGVLYRRLWSNTYGKWLTDWIKA